MKNKKTALTKSFIALLLCVAMFIGCTFAWFTDSASSKDNIIQSGNLDIEMYWTDDLENGTWHNVEDDEYNTIFSYENWEPGYTDVKYIKLVNNGNLALNYKLTLTPQNGVGKLAEVINVYFANSGVNVEKREDINRLGAIGLLSNVLNGGATADGTLLAANQTSPLHPSGEVVMTIAMNMITSAGNDYQGESSGDFTITALATQASFESDSFGNSYDSNAKFPTILTPSSATAPVTPVNGKVPAGGVTLDGGKISAFVPEGVALENGTDKLTLTITPLKDSTSDITVVNNEVLIPVDVHIDGISDSNNVPIIIDLGEVLPKYLNMGNYRLFHVEDGTNREMTLVSNKTDLTAHNRFTYNPLTGEVSVAMASFSEVALVADTSKAWKGEEDYDWYNTTDKELYIANADQLHAFAKIVGGMSTDFGIDSFSGKTVTLLSDINLNNGTVLNDAEGTTKTIFYPIGYNNNKSFTSGNEINRPTELQIEVSSGVNPFQGTFDGNGHTISNIYQNTWEMFGDYNSGYPANSNYYKDGMGLFAWVDGTVKNLTVHNFESDGEFTPTGVIAAYAGYNGNASFENIAITECNPRVYNTGNGGIVGIGGNESAENKIAFKNITVDNTNKITALWGSWDVACGGLMGMFRGKDSNIAVVTMNNCHVAAQMDVYNDVCGNYQYYWYRYSGMMVGTNYNMTTDENGYTVPNTKQYKAENCTVHFGDWNNYYYCELVANSLASYTHDHQFSRLEEIQNVSEIRDENGNWKRTGNFILMNGKNPTETCYHIMKDSKENLYEHKHDVADATNKDIYETKDINGDGVVDSNVLKENNQRIELPFNQLFTGYGWGVRHIPIYDDGTGFSGITILGRDVADSVEKFETKFTGDFLYRVGNGNSFEIGNLFKEKDGLANDLKIKDSGVWVSLNKVDEKSNISGTFTANTDDWTKGTIKFSGTGLVKITIQDYYYCTPTELIVEVVDATNAISATDATSKNVVLLSNISSGFTVSGNHTFFGNGFTLNYTGNGQYLNNGLRQGIVNVSENGTLDNLRIKASIYPASYLYYDEVKKGPSSVEGDKTRYHYQLSAIVAKDSATISNCYAYGGRTNIFVDTGNVTITDTILECGTLANIQIQSTEESTVTLNNITTIQKRVNPTIGETTQVMMGAGIIVGPDTETNPNIVLNGDFKQYNWVNAKDKEAVTNSTAQTIIQTALDATVFNHTINGVTASNLGIIYLNNAAANVTNNTRLPYKFGNVTMMNQDGKVYSLQNATEKQIYSDVENADRATVNGDYMPTFKFDLGDQEISYDGSEDTRYLYGDVNGVTALYKDGEDPITLDLSKLATAYKYTGIAYNCTAVCKNSSGTELNTSNGVVTLDAQGEYTLVFTVVDNVFYDKDGNPITKSVNREYTVPLKLTVKAADIKNATVNITKTALDGVYTTVNLTDYKLRVNFLDCISVTDYDNKGTGAAVNLTSGISSATLTPSGVNVFTTASTITVTYTDGRVLTVNLSKISGSSPGTKTAIVNTSGGLYFITEGALDNKPTEASSQNKCTITSVSYKGNSGSTVTNDTDVTVTWPLGSSSGGGCVTPDTLITLADGTQKRVDELTGAEELLVWNHETGKLDKAPVAYIVDHNGVVENREIIHLNFANGKTVKMIGEHVFFDATLNKYVAVTTENADALVGHTFATLSADGTVIEKTVLASVDRTVEETAIYEVVSYKHLTCFTEGILSTSAYLDPLLNVFDVDTETMAYTAEDVQKDIETYGLYTYEDFDGLIEEEAFELYNAKYLKIAVGKGYITWGDVLELIDIYFGVDVQPIH